MHESSTAIPKEVCTNITKKGKKVQEKSKKEKQQGTSQESRNKSSKELRKQLCTKGLRTMQ